MKNKKLKAKSIMITTAQILLGGLLIGIGIRWFFFPASLISGGLTGISMIINYLTNLPTGALIIALNIPVFIFAFKSGGGRFVVSSLIGMIISSVFIDIFSVIDVVVTTNPLLAAVFGGVLTGAGFGLFFLAGSNTGGASLLSLMLRKKYSINVGTFILAIDAVVVSAYALIFMRLDNAMYTVIAAFISSRVIDTILYGLPQSKLFYVISDHCDSIRMSIAEELGRGVTMIKGTGAYTGADKCIILCVVKSHQVMGIRKLIRNIDEKAFVIVTDTRGVFGEGFGDILED